ncbi:MAG TPA: response regulator transcription factor [Burkholderiales bacterium]|nr:response regulator transcription factor [Burkholderiales bacterium]
MNRTEVTRVMLVGEDPVLENALRQSAPEPDILELVGVACSAAEAAAKTGEMQPDVILLDIEACGLGAVARMCALGVAPVLAIGAAGDPSMRASAVRAGARGVVQKSDAPAFIRKALQKVREGELWLDRSSTARLFEELLGGSGGGLPEGKIANLTIRESDIVRALLRHEGASSRELAQNLSMSEQTLRNHFSSIYRKLGIPNRVGLVAYAARHRLDGAG